MKIYTKSGDEGTTSLIGGTRVSKSHYRVEAYGTVDELNAHMGLVRDLEVNAKRENLFHQMQNKLFVIGAILASAPDNENNKVPALKAEDVAVLEKAIDEMQNDLPPMHYFILPGGHTAVSFCHLARCVCRRAERLIVQLHEKEGVEPLVIVYLNRLSDYLFVLSRKVAQELNVQEIHWKGSEKSNR